MMGMTGKLESWDDLKAGTEFLKAVTPESRNVLNDRNNQDDRNDQYIGETLLSFTHRPRNASSSHLL
jgi:hypothetical protein